MSKERGEEGIGVFLRIRPAPTTQQSRLLAAGSGGKGVAASPSSSNAAAAFQYEVDEDFNKSVLHLHTAQRLVQDAQRPAAAASAASGNSGPGPSPPLVEDVVNNTVVDFQYRFDRVFKPSATQEDVFNTVAKGCVQSVLDGMNSTVFAYGQTGSGKTFSITGGTESYQDRGLIPRAMAMIYEEVARRREGGGTATAASDADTPGGGGGAATTYTITMSYLQIYNDKGQDLLNHGRDARTLEELPPVTIHEMEEDIMLKGLEQHSAPTLSDALNLLFLGDTNRLYCETPMNKTSSRSHCIFTIYLEARSATSSVVRRSKLNLVDLAGSERVSKTGVSGTILTEAKHINLSLHFLEQVIVALSEKAKGVREHVPYRNAFLTMVLRDSLGRNCKTVMLATAHVVASQVAETISTCQFAQRVALIKQAPHVNTETDPALLVRKLRAEVAQLKDEVAHLRANGGGGGAGAAALPADRVLAADEKAVCRGMVDAYVHKATVDGDWSSRLTGLQGDLARIYYCFDLLRERVVRGGGGGAGSGNAGSVRATADDGALAAQQEQQRQARLLADSEAQVAALRQSLQLKENELQMLLTVLRKSGSAGGGGGGGAAAAAGGGAAVRYTAAAQSPSPDGGAAADEPFEFFGPAADAASDATARWRCVYQDAQALVARLRRAASSTSASTAASAALQEAAAAAAVTAERGAAAALTRVTALAQQGHLSEAEVAAATEFLERKRDVMRRGGADADDAVETGDEADADGRSAVDVLLDEQLVQDRARALEAFKTSYEAQHKVEETKQLLRPKYAACKATAQQLNTCVDAIKQLKTKIQRRRAERAADGCDEVDAEETAWLAELGTAKEQYNACAAQLRHDKEEIDGVHAYLKHAQEQLVRDFERWFSARQQQVQLAVQQQQRQAQRQQSVEKKGELTDQLRALLNGGTMAATAAGATPPTTTIAADDARAATPASRSVDSPNFSLAAQMHPPQPPPQSFAASAPHSLAAMPPPGQPSPPSTLLASTVTTSTTTMTNTAAEASPFLSDNNALLQARGQHRLASLPPPVQSARCGTADGQPRSAGATFARVSPPPLTSSASVGAVPHEAVVARPGVVAAQNGWTGGAAAVPLPLPSDSPPPVSAMSARPPASPAALLGPRLQPGTGGAGPAVGSPPRPFHLQPIRDDANLVPGVNLGMSSTSTTPHGAVSEHLAGRGAAPAANGASSFASVDKPKPGNPYFPQMPSTGNAAADAQLAELYKAREAMRKQLQ